jgi:hypothetical protein
MEVCEEALACEVIEAADASNSKLQKYSFEFFCGISWYIIR